MKVKKHETVILDAEMAVTRTESGMDYVQVLPDHPSVGQVVPFSGWGSAERHVRLHPQEARAQEARIQGSAHQPLVW